VQHPEKIGAAGLGSYRCPVDDLWKHHAKEQGTLGESALRAVAHPAIRRKDFYSHGGTDSDNQSNSACNSETVQIRDNRGSVGKERVHGVIEQRKARRGERKSPPKE
jgi:hypothetical protein